MAEILPRLAPEAYRRWCELTRIFCNEQSIAAEPVQLLERHEPVRRAADQGDPISKEAITQHDAMLRALVTTGVQGKIRGNCVLSLQPTELTASHWLRLRSVPDDALHRWIDLAHDRIVFIQVSADSASWDRRLTDWDGGLTIWDGGEIVALDGVSIELAPVAEDRRSHSKPPNAAAEPGARGRRPGGGKVEELAWPLAEAVLVNDKRRPARGYGRLRALATAISSDRALRAYKLSTIEKSLRASLREWEKRYPEK